MMSDHQVLSLPHSTAPDLHLANPSQEEQEQVWSLNFESWGGALSLEQYLEREAYLTNVPLSRDGGVTHWILVEKGLPPNQRPILASCETLLKPSLVSDKDGNVRDVISHGIGSVFCDPAYRGRGYVTRMLRELKAELRVWQSTEDRSPAFSVLWSDIGSDFYGRHGWLPFPSTHVEFPPTAVVTANDVRRLASKDLRELCLKDAAQVRTIMGRAKEGKIMAAISPNEDHLQWHHMRENFLCNKIFGKEPVTKGAIIGEPGHRMWAIWTRSYYGPIEPESGNTLHILRLVIEGEEGFDTLSTSPGILPSKSVWLDDQSKKLKAIIQIAQAEAMEWKLNHVELWNPSGVVQTMIDRMDVKHVHVRRDDWEKDQSIPSLLWFGGEQGGDEDLEWIGNEKYGWC